MNLLFPLLKYYIFKLYLFPLVNNLLLLLIDKKGIINFFYINYYFKIIINVI